RVFTTIHGHDEGNAASTFNRRFDILFAEDSKRRVNGRLHHIRRGEFGMAIGVKYLHSIKWSAPDMNLGGTELKLVRVIKELEFLSGMTASEAAKKASAARKSGSVSKQAEGAKKSKKSAPTPAKQLTRHLRDSSDNESEAQDPSYCPQKKAVALSEEEDVGLRAVAVADGNGSRCDGYRPVRCGRGTYFLTDGYVTGLPVDGWPGAGR
ncbi:hypothetical protein B0H16DRAFT_1826158, partial [Mycena metata]